MASCAPSYELLRMRQRTRRSQGGILVTARNDVLGALQWWGSTWCIKHTRSYLSRAITAPQAGATLWVC